MPKCRTIRGIAVLLTVAVMATGLLGGCGSKANGEARTRLDASIVALRDSAAKLKTLEGVMEEFAADAPGLKSGKFAARRAEVAAAIDDAAATAAKTRAESEAAKAVPGVSDKIIPQAADFLIDQADSTDKVLQSSRTTLDKTMGSPAKFSRLSARSTRAIVLLQTGMIGKRAEIASEAADRIEKVLGK
jgi:hypothetical protein